MNRKRMKLFRMKFSAAGMASVLIFVGSLLILLAAFWIAFRTYGHGDADIAALGFLALFFNILGIFLPLHDMKRRGNEEGVPVLSRVAVILNVLVIVGILGIYILGIVA
ncbi:MAG: hypothetical protein HFI65_09575 [Lachnospiraceae bacterium]|nr:hypothetical protein [Lachnospiraceae bacterium]